MSRHPADPGPLRQARDCLLALLCLAVLAAALVGAAELLARAVELALEQARP